MLDSNSRLKFLSPNAEKLFGYSIAECYERGASILFDVHPDEAQQVSRMFQSFFAEGVPFDLEFRIRRKDGEWRWVHNRAIQTFEKNGLRYASGLVTDITQRKAAEESLRESEQRYRLLFERNLAGVFRCSLQGILLNTTMQGPGYWATKKRADLIGRPVMDVFFEPCRQGVIGPENGRPGNCFQPGNTHAS